MPTWVLPILLMMLCGLLGFCLAIALMVYAIEHSATASAPADRNVVKVAA